MAQMRRNLSTGIGGWRSAIFIIFVEVAERFAYYGVAGNLISYLTKKLHQPIATAAINVNVWQGVSAIFPILGGIFADSYLGRFKTILISSLIYFLGLVLLTITVTIIPEHREALFFISIYILAIGEGGHKPCVQTFAADQFNEELPEEKEAKSSFFNWWYVGIVCGSTTAVLVIIYVQEYISWGISFAVLAAAVAIALVIFLGGIRTYRRQPALKSPFTRVAQVFVAAFRKRHLVEQRRIQNFNMGSVPVVEQLVGRDVSYYYEDDEEKDVDDNYKAQKLSRTTQFRFLDNATIIDEIDASNEKKDSWRLCSTNQVEEVKLVLRLIPLWIFSWMFAVVVSQQGTFFTKQGNTLRRSIAKHEFPAASLQVITGLTILLSISIYDKIIVPFARKLSGHPSGITVLQRIGAGLFTSIITMVVAALVEAKRLNVARKHGLLDEPKAIIPMTIWWLVPQYMLMGITDVLSYVGLQELFYDQMPQGLRSMGAAACISIVGLGNFMSSVIISIIQEIGKGEKSGNKWLGDNLNRAHLNYFFLVLAGLSGLNLIAYIWVAMMFVYKKVEKSTFVEVKENQARKQHG
ncbi:hypothetical protein Leryth_002108 [Lithospermum erythrorhizon]|nr:hypothetical protein Leryth_002108 [Lithospermum erythrorhizon]